MWLDILNKMKKDSGYTTEEIAIKSGIPRGTLNKLFAGQTKDPQLSTLKAVVHALGYTLDDLDDEAPQTRDQVLLEKYHEADPVTQKNVDKLLDMPE